MLQLKLLPANQRYVFTFGEALLRMEGERLFFSTRREAVEAAERHGLAVSKLGIVHVQRKEP